MENENLFVRRIVNNNIVVADDGKGQEIIVVGKGLGFKKEIHDIVYPHEIIKTYILIDSQSKRKLLMLFDEVPYVVIELTQKIIEMAQRQLKVTFNVNLVIALADHINFSVNQFKAGCETISLVNEEIKRFYKEEHEVGLRALNMINQTLNVRLNKEESSSLAFHLITATENKSNQDVLKVMKGVKDIVKIAEGVLSVDLDEDSMSTSRFIIHLKYFMRRVLFEDKKTSKTLINAIYSQIRTDNSKTDLCIERISEYMLNNYNYIINNDERLYLLIHVTRLLEYEL